MAYVVYKKYTCNHKPLAVKLVTKTTSITRARTMFEIEVGKTAKSLQEHMGRYTVNAKSSDRKYLCRFNYESDNEHNYELVIWIGTETLTRTEFESLR